MRAAALTLALFLAACGGSGTLSGGGATSGAAPTPTPTPSPTATPTPTATPIAALAPNFELVIRNGVSIPLEDQAAVAAAGANTVVDGVDPLDGYVAKSRAATIATADPAALNVGATRLVAAPYLGAIDPAAPTAFSGWACPAFNLSLTYSAGCSFRTGTTAPACPPGTGRDLFDRDTTATTSACFIPSGTLTADLRLPSIPGVIYSVAQLRVGRDVGVNGGAADGVAATLTIDAGVAIKSAYTLSGSYARNTAFIAVQRGSKIVVNGTADAPVQFGGILSLVLAGRAPTNKCLAGTSRAAGTCEYNYSLQNADKVVINYGNYGGAMPGDSSGSIRYLFIGGGASVASGVPQMNLMGVGSGTTLDHIQLADGSQQGLFIAGGAANLSYLLVSGSNSEMIYIAEGWRGAMQFVLGVQKAADRYYFFDTRTLRVDEEDGRDDSTPRTRGTIANFTFIQVDPNIAAPVLIGNGVDVTLANGIIKTPSKCVAMAASTTANGGASTIRPAGGTGGVPGDIDEAGPPRFLSDYLACLGR